MTNTSAKLFLFLSICLAIDIIKPLGYLLKVDFLILGIIFAILNTSLVVSFTLSVFFGCLSAVFAPYPKYLTLFEFLFFCIIRHYFLVPFFLIGNKQHLSTIKKIIGFSGIIVHIIIRSVSSGTFIPLFAIHFFLQSLVFFLLIIHLMKGLDATIYLKQAIPIDKRYKTRNFF